MENHKFFEGESEVSILTFCSASKGYGPSVDVGDRRNETLARARSLVWFHSAFGFGSIDRVVVDYASAMTPTCELRSRLWGAESRLVL
jgi:hypothetical protein